MDDKIRKLITYLKMYRQRVDIECFCCKREHSGTGLIQLELIHKITSIVLKDILKHNTLDAAVSRDNEKQKKNIQFVKEVIILQFCSTVHRKKLTYKDIEALRQ